MKPQQIPLSEIAQALALSRTTVSRALSGKGRVNAETVRRVRQYLLESGSQAANRSGSLALILPVEHNTPADFWQLARAVGDEAAASGLPLVLLPDEGQALLHILQQSHIDGILLPSTLLPLAQQLNQKGMPCVLLGGPMQGQLPQVYFDQQAAAQELAEILLAKGAQRLVFVCSAPLQQVQTAWIGLQNGCRAADAAPPVYVPFPGRACDGLAPMFARMMCGQPDAVVCNDPDATRELLYHCRINDIAVPGQLRLACLQDSPFLADAVPSVTAVRCSAEQMGRQAVRQLLAGEQGQCLLPHQLILRGSTRL